LVEEFSVNGQKIVYKVTGEGTPLLTINNLAMPIDGWWPTPWIPRLNEAGYKIVTFQHLGPEPASNIDLAGDIGALMDHLRLESAFLWGYSQGASITLELALLRPDVVAGAVLMAAGLESAYSKLMFAGWNSIGEHPGEFPELNAYLMLATSSSPHLLTDDDYVDSIAKAMQSGPRMDPEAQRRLRHAGGTDRNRLEALAQMKVPCLVIAFERDLMSLPAHSREVAEAIPGSRFIEIPGVGHDGVGVRGHEVIKHVLEFFASV
jgi:pimeloyl-ACP methyl ester carboxylesterase